MKKFLPLLLLVAFCCVLTFALSSCGECTHPNMQKTELEASCTQAGKTNYTCPDCGISYNDDVTAPKGHKFEGVITPPTCQDGGYITYTCTCGQSYVSDHLDALGHDYSKEFYTIAPTCTELGYSFYACSRCDHSYTADYVKPTNHNLSRTTVEPTCTEQGYISYKCADCKYAFDSDHKAPTGHDFADGAKITAPTCKDHGYTTYSCRNCDYSYVSDFTEPSGHTYTEKSVKATTCNETGITVFACECGDEYSVITEPTGHSFSRLVTMPTLSDMGYTEFSCQNEGCGFTYTGELKFYSDILPDAYADSSDVLAKGIDVSYHNYKKDANGQYIPLDWQSIKESGIDYVIIRAGYTSKETGAFEVDETFELSYVGAKAAGLDVGAYFYTCATSVEDIVIEANLLINLLHGKQFEYPIYLDLEDEGTYLTEDKTALLGISKARLNQMCVEFFSTLQRAGYYTGLYVNDNWLYTIIDTDSAISNFDIWYARFPGVEAPVWNPDKSEMPFGMWQYSDKGSIDGVGEPFDINLCYKDYPSIIKTGGFNGYESDIKFPDSQKTFIIVTYPYVNVRSVWELSDNSNILGQAVFGDKLEVIEIREDCAKVYYNDQEAFISKNPAYVTILEII